MTCNGARSKAGKQDINKRSNAICLQDNTGMALSPLFYFRGGTLSGPLPHTQPQSTVKFPALGIKQMSLYSFWVLQSQAQKK